MNDEERIQKPITIMSMLTAQDQQEFLSRADMGDFLYCITSDCMAWVKENEEDGYCKRLKGEHCKCSNEKKGQYQI